MMAVPMVALPGGWEWIVVLLVVVMVFGVTKLSSALPELAKGTGQALRIFKSETKALRDDDDKDGKGAKDAPSDGTITADDAATSGTSPTTNDARAALPPVQTPSERRTEVPSERQDHTGI